MAWTDNREVVGGADPRELEADGYDDGFDVLQCRIDLGAGPALTRDVPLARRDAPVQRRQLRQRRRARPGHLRGAARQHRLNSTVSKRIHLRCCKANRNGSHFSRTV